MQIYLVLMEGNWRLYTMSLSRSTHISFTLTGQKLAEKPRFQIWLLHNWGISFYNCAFCWKGQDYFLSSGCVVTSAMAQCDIVTRVTSAVVQFDNCDKCDKCSGTVWRFPVVGTFVLLDGNDPNAPKAEQVPPTTSWSPIMAPPSDSYTLYLPAASCSDHQLFEQCPKCFIIASRT